MDNIILTTDSYKVSHALQYPPNTRHVFSYFCSRGGKWPETVFFSLQYQLKKYLEGKRVTQAFIDEAEDYYGKHFGNPGIFNKQGWQYILNQHGGRLPVSIRAVSEGSVVPVGNALMTVENTDPKCFWLTNYLETLLVQTWYGSTVATQSREMKKIILAALQRTGDPSLIDFKLHDFGFRGSTSVESAQIGGAAHLTNFQGTDTIAGIYLARKYYECDMAGFSIPAAEHSTITSWGRENEVLAYQNMLEQFPTGLVAVVSDSYNIYEACHKWGGILKDKVLARDGVLVIRPDSGHPPDVIVAVLDILGEHFGAIANKKGYRVLDPHVRVIQGDGIDYEMLQSILGAMEENRWSADNIAFGSGGGLLQKVNRDTQKFAFKCCAIDINGQIHEVSKSPIGAPDKASMGGVLKLVRQASGYKTMRIQDDVLPNVLEERFRDGAIMNTTTFAEIRERARIV